MKTLDPASTLPPIPMTDAENVEALRDVLSKLVDGSSRGNIMYLLTEADDVLARTVSNT